jgi:hypothetical protein
MIKNSIKPTFHTPVAPRATHEGLAVALARHRPLLGVRPPVTDPPIQRPFSATFYYGKVSRDGDEKLKIFVIAR